MNASLPTPPRKRQARTRRAPNRGLRLRPGDVDLWRAALDEQPPEAVQFMQTLMSADEAERARRFYFERDRRRFIVGRGILRLILGNYLKLSPKDLIFRYGANGKPALAPSQAGAPPLYFNVAHSEGLALLAFSRVGEVGIDLERIREIPEWEQVAASSFSPRELARIYAAPADQRIEEFFRAWTGQEAILKALGVGLNGVTSRQRNSGTGLLPRGFEAYGSEGPGHPELARRAEAETSFCVHPLNPGPGYVAALAADRAGRRTNCLNWKASEPLAQFPFHRPARRIRLESLPQNGASFL